MTCARERPCIFPRRCATNLAFVAIQDSSIAAVQSGRLGYTYGLKWPRQVYGRLVEELSAQGAKAVAFDVQFGELRPDHPLSANGRRQLDRLRRFFCVADAGSPAM